MARRPRPAASVAGEASSSRTTTRYSPPMPLVAVQPSPSYLSEAYYSPEPRYEIGEYADDEDEIGEGQDDGNHDQDHDAASPRTSSPPSSRLESLVIGKVTLELTDALDCGICFPPLKPPIFQGDVGHVVCSLCRDKLVGAGRCHVCRAATGFERCHAMEQLVDSVRVPCPHAAHGCADRPAYHDGERHARECAHAPMCRCPRDACCFAGPTVALVERLTAVHGWPCTAEASAGRSFGVDLRDGFNFLTAVRGNAQYLLLLNMASTAFGRAISVVWLHSDAVTASSSALETRNTKIELELYYSCYKQNLRGHYYQKCRFEVACTDLSNGLPDPNASFQFFVPKYVVAFKSQC